MPGEWYRPIKPATFIFSWLRIESGSVPWALQHIVTKPIITVMITVRSKCRIHLLQQDGAKVKSN